MKFEDVTAEILKGLHDTDILGLDFLCQHSAKDLDAVNVEIEKALRQAHELITAEGAERGYEFTPLAKSLYTENPPEDKQYRYTIQNHFRGKSVHTDLRLETGDAKSVIGWTLNTQLPGRITKPVETLEDAKREDANPGNFKINFVNGKFATRPKEGTDELVRASIVSERKQPAPIAWLDFEGVNKFAGATKNFPGVFHIVDKGNVEYGIQRPDFHEYFLTGGSLRGRFVFRQLELQKSLFGKPEVRQVFDFADMGTEAGIKDLVDTIKAVIPKSEEMSIDEPAWLLIKPDNQTPFVLSNDAVKEKAIPPFGVSALPLSVKNKIPDEFKYWNEKEESERLKIRKALVEAIKAGSVKINFATLVAKGCGGKPEIEKFLNGEIEITAHLIKADKMKQIITGVVLESEVWDGHNEIVSPEAVEDTAYKWLAEYRRATELGIQHSIFGENGIELYESWVHRTGDYEGTKVSPPAWLMTLHITDDSLWKKVLDGKFTGLSIRGMATVIPEKKPNA